MSVTLSSMMKNLDNLCRELELLCGSGSPMELLERLTKMLCAYTKGQPVALYRRLITGNLRLVCCYPLEGTLGSNSPILSVRCYDDLVASQLQLYELTGDQGVWGYIGYPPGFHSEPAYLAQLLVDMSSKRLRSLKAERLATRQSGLRSRRKLLSRDIKRLSSIDDILQQHGASWCDIFQADGIVLVYQGDLHCFGEHPPSHQLLHQLQQLHPHEAHNKIVELNGRCQGSVATQFSLASTHFGWLLLFRQRPLIPALAKTTALQDALSYWMPLEASMITELADDLAVAVTAQEFVHLNRHLTKTNQLLEGLAHTDHLTKCWNRYYTELVIEGLINSSVSFAMLMFDIDDFKNINDTYGHATGDDILRNMAQLVQETLRHEDHLGRWGGEEFVIISKGLDQDASLKLSNQLCRNVEQHTFDIAGQLTISIGLTLVQPGDRPCQLLERAEQGMHLAKLTGKKQVFVY